MTGENEAWVAVLAAVEADMLISRELVSGNGTGGIDAGRPGAADGIFSGALGPMSLGAPAPPPAPVLPPLDQMPPVPEELGERILELRAQIIELQFELAAQLKTFRARQAGLRRAGRAVSPIPTTWQAHYVDRRL